jgi:hypothetical protein
MFLLLVEELVLLQWRVVGIQRFNAEAPLAWLVSAEVMESATGTGLFPYHLPPLAHVHTLYPTPHLDMYPPQFIRTHV